MTRIDGLRARVLSLPFKETFRHASAERAAMQSIWVEATGEGRTGLGEGCPREYVTGESLAGALAFIEQLRERVIDSVFDADSLRRFVEDERAAIDANPAAWCAIELAVLDLLAQSAGVPMERLLAVPEARGTFRYSAVIGDGSTEAFSAQVARYRKAGFAEFKIKLSGDAERDGMKVVVLRQAGIPPGAVRADANNLFRNAAEAIRHLAALDFAFLAIEEPVGAGDYDGMRRIATALRTRIVVDESLSREDQVPFLAGDAGTWIANIRVSKMGGLVRSLEVARKAMESGIDVIVGAHVGETSVLTRAGLVVAASARERLIAQEGAFGTHLLEHDMVDPPLMFGAGGILRR